MNDSLQSITAAKQRKEDIRLKCLELAALMSGPQTAKEGETVQHFLERFIPLSNVIELHATGSLPSAGS